MSEMMNFYTERARDTYAALACLILEKFADICVFFGVFSSCTGGGGALNVVFLPVGKKRGRSAANLPFYSPIRAALTGGRGIYKFIYETRGDFLFVAGEGLKDFTKAGDVSLPLRFGSKAAPFFAIGKAFRLIGRFFDDGRYVFSCLFPICPFRLPIPDLICIGPNALLGLYRTFASGCALYRGQGGAGAEAGGGSAEWEKQTCSRQGQGGYRSA
ncbi:MAG: hypothetical protein LBL66_05610 [Clostridiales bacterium]|jgi:hypothetical protein|nr:hypothetical protein [Clostridiales bacterium]